jgi:hypothetical protein
MATEEKLALVLLIAALLGTAVGAVLFFPFGLAIAFLAAACCGALGILLAGGWLAYAHRRTRSQAAANLSQGSLPERGASALSKRR